MPTDIIATLLRGHEAVIEATSPAGARWMRQQTAAPESAHIVDRLVLGTWAAHATAAGLRVVVTEPECEAA